MTKSSPIIVLVVSSFPKLSETFIVSKFLGLVEHRWNVHIVCETSDREEWTRFERLGFRALGRRVHVNWPHKPHWLAACLAPIAVSYTFLRSPARAWHYLAAGWQLFGVDILRRFYLDAELIALAPNLIHFEFGALAVGRMYLKGLLNCKIVVSFRGYDLNYVGLEEQDYYKQVWDKADAIHALGQDLSRRARQRGLMVGRTARLIPPAINCDVFTPERDRLCEDVGTPERPLHLLSVGRLEWIKGYEYGLEAVRHLLDEGICLEYRIVGDGSFIEAVAFARHELGLEENIWLLGALGGEQVKEQMEWADIFLHSAVSEGFGNVVLEAQAMELPVVCSDAGGLVENVEDGVSGFVVKRRAPDMLANKILILTRDVELRRRMGKAGRRRVIANYSLPDQIVSFETLYSEVAGSQPLSSSTADSLEPL